MNRGDSAHEAEVPGFDDVRRLYRDESGPIEPPAAVDAAILAASRRAVGRPVLTRAGAAPRRWQAPLAAAAVVVLATSLAVLFRESAPPMRERDVPPGLPSESAPAPASPGPVVSAGDAGTGGFRETAKPGDGGQSLREAARSRQADSAAAVAPGGRPEDSRMQGAAPGLPAVRDPGQPVEVASAPAPAPASAEAVAPAAEPVQKASPAAPRADLPTRGDVATRRAGAETRTASDPRLAERAADAAGGLTAPVPPSAPARAAQLPSSVPSASSDPGAVGAAADAGQPTAPGADSALAERLAAIRRLWESGRRAEAVRQLEDLLRGQPELSLPPDYPVPRPARR